MTETGDEHRPADGMVAVPTAVAEDFTCPAISTVAAPTVKMAAWLRVGLDALDGGNRATPADRAIVEPPAEQVPARELLTMDPLPRAVAGRSDVEVTPVRDEPTGDLLAVRVRAWNPLHLRYYAPDTLVEVDW